MVVLTSQNSVLLIGEESTFNTPVTPTKDLGLIQSISPSESNTTEEHYTTGARDVQQTTAGKYDQGMDLTVKYQHGRIYEMLMGNATDNVTSSDYTHIFLDKNNDEGFGAVALSDTINSYTIEDSSDAATDAGDKFAGVKVNSITANFAIGSVLTYSTNMIGSSNTVVTSAGTNIVSSLPLLEHFKSHLSTGADGAEVEHTLIQDGSLTIANNLEGAEGLASRENQELVALNLNVSFSFTKIFENNTEKQRFLGGSSTSSSTPTGTTLIFNTHNGVTLGSGRREFYAKVENAQYNTTEKATAIGAKIIQTFAGTGELTVLFAVDNISSYF